MNILEVKKLNYKVGNKTILNNISFKIEKGSFTTILGKNGSGKSTILKFITNNIKSDSIFLNEINLNKYTDLERSLKIAYISQLNYSLVDYTVLEYVLMARMPYQSFWKDYSTEDINIALKYLKMFNILSFKNRKISTLSGGEFQKVNLARACTQETDIIILDEATSALDISASTKVLDYLRELNTKYNKTIIMVLHDLNKAYKYSDNVILLKDGNLIEYGKTKEILNVKNIKKCFDIDSKFIKNNKEEFIIF